MQVRCYLMVGSGPAPQAIFFGFTHSVSVFLKEIYVFEGIIAQIFPDPSNKRGVIRGMSQKSESDRTD